MREKWQLQFAGNGSMEADDQTMGTNTTAVFLSCLTLCSITVCRTYRNKPHLLNDPPLYCTASQECATLSMPFPLVGFTYARAPLVKEG